MTLFIKEGLLFLQKTPFKVSSWCVVSRKCPLTTRVGPCLQPVSLPAPASAFEFQSRVDIWTKWRQCNKAFLSGNVKLEPGSSSSDSSPIPKCHYSLLWSFYETLCSLTILLSVYLVYLAETAMAPHSSTLARKTPWTEEPGGLQSMGLRRVGHDWSDLAAAAAAAAAVYLGICYSNQIYFFLGVNPIDGIEDFGLEMAGLLSTMETFQDWIPAVRLTTCCFFRAFSATVLHSAAHSPASFQAKLTSCHMPWNS